MDAGDILADNLVLEDIYNIAQKYDLDSVRFSFSKNYYDSNFIEKRILMIWSCFLLMLRK